ncbi:MAG: (E)-4-hydroxy-3-methylbut-2-enyl-diphosphate synthase [Verrucomicrobiae bacterium]|nr:(E)-4-hydroxy-3-methylbut-2-enyl-diphosphate synthase [Verrucomicrobiae bacterium]
MQTAPLFPGQNPFVYRRRRTREVKVGDVGIGGDNPIRVQSMTSSDTENTEATVREVMDLVEAGCEIVRITAPTVKDAENLRFIRDELCHRGCRVPLVADIHFMPKAALVAVEFVEKVRINPGNYADKKKFASRDYTDAEYQEELGRIEEAFLPLVKRCRELGRALRLGVNHGSLSDRIMNRFGDTPRGMVESALEFAEICRRNDFHGLVFSMKASSVKLVIQAYRLLAARMSELGMDYPFHLGVTEAGDGEDGRIKSAIGMGALLDDGIGDTVRVSLTEDSVREIPVCWELVRPYNERLKQTVSEPPAWTSGISEKRDPFACVRRQTVEVRQGDYAAGGSQTIRVEIPIQLHDFRLAYEAASLLGAETPAEMLVVRVGDDEACRRLKDLANRYVEASFAADLGEKPEMLEDALFSGVRKLVFCWGEQWDDAALERLFKEAAARSLLVQADIPEKRFEKAGILFDLASRMAPGRFVVGIGELVNLQVSGACRLLAAIMDSKNVRFPIHLREQGPFTGELDRLLSSSRQLGGLLCDGLGDSIQVGDGNHPREALQLAYNILQGTGHRVTRTEYITCPSCGRTLFNLQPIVERIKKRTFHLKGVKIAIMGCIVNGPGEMADADFGYVGGAPGKINLYVGKECVEVNVPEADAEDRLVELIKKHGLWRDPN